MSVTETVELEESVTDFNPQVVAALLEVSQRKYHKILLVQDEDGSTFYRETTSFVSGDDDTEFFGPFADAASALWGISLL